VLKKIRAEEEGTKETNHIYLEGGWLVCLSS